MTSEYDMMMSGLLMVVVAFGFGHYKFYDVNLRFLIKYIRVKQIHWIGEFEIKSNRF